MAALAAAAVRSDPAIGAWMVQCSDLPPYSADIAQATGMPVWDMALLIEHLHGAVRRRSYRREAAWA